MAGKYRSQIIGFTFGGKKHDLSCTDHAHNTPETASACGDRTLRVTMADTTRGTSKWLELRKIIVEKSEDSEGNEIWLRYSINQGILSIEQAL